VDDETGLEYQRMRDHWVVLGVGVFLDCEFLSNSSLDVGKEDPLGTDRCTKFLKRMVVVCCDRDQLSVCHRDLWVEGGEFQVLLVFLRATMPARQGKYHRIVALQLTELASCARLSIARSDRGRCDESIEP
jgi:hypothetical protein